MENYVKRFYEGLYRAIRNITGFAYGDSKSINFGQVSIENSYLEEITYDGKKASVDRLVVQSKRNDKCAKEHSCLDKKVGIEINGNRMFFLNRW